MKKSILLYAIIIVVLGLTAVGYWYWQSQNPTATSVDTLQTVALGNPDIDSFDDVCTAGENGALNCTGNIEKFGCTSYTNIDERVIGLQPAYEAIGCLKEHRSASTDGVYQLPRSAYVDPRDVDYIILKDGVFQLIQSVDELQRVFQPIENVDEAKAYFSLLGKGFLVLDEELLSRIRYPQFLGDETDGYRFVVSPDSIELSEVSELADGFSMTAYSSFPMNCIDEVYFYTYLLKRDGRLIEKNKQLIWESVIKPSCVE